MRRVLTKIDANQTLRITPARHRDVKHLAVDRSTSLIEIADEVIAAGVEVVRSRQRPESFPSAN